MKDSNNIYIPIYHHIYFLIVSFKDIQHYTTTPLHFKKLKSEKENYFFKNEKLKKKSQIDFFEV